MLFAITLLPDWYWWDYAFRFSLRFIFFAKIRLTPPLRYAAMYFIRRRFISPPRHLLPLSPTWYFIITLSFAASSPLLMLMPLSWFHYAMILLRHIITLIIIFICRHADSAIGTPLRRWLDYHDYFHARALCRWRAMLCALWDPTHHHHHARLRSAQRMTRLFAFRDTLSSFSWLIFAFLHYWYLFCW